MNAKQIAVQSPYKHTIKFNECVAIKRVFVLDREVGLEMSLLETDEVIFQCIIWDDLMMSGAFRLINLDFWILSRFLIPTLAYL